MLYFVHQYIYLRDLIASPIVFFQSPVKAMELQIRGLELKMFLVLKWSVQLCEKCILLLKIIKQYKAF